jgi:hypothetical protein
MFFPAIKNKMKTSFIKTGSGIRKIRGGIHGHTRQHGIRISLLSFFQNKERRLTKRCVKSEDAEIQDYFNVTVKSENSYERFNCYKMRQDCHLHSKSYSSYRGMNFLLSTSLCSLSSLRTEHSNSQTQNSNA